MTDKDFSFELKSNNLVNLMFIFKSIKHAQQYISSRVEWDMNVKKKKNIALIFFKNFITYCKCFIFKSTYKTQVTKPLANSYMVLYIQWKPCSFERMKNSYNTTCSDLCSDPCPSSSITSFIKAGLLAKFVFFF